MRIKWFIMAVSAVAVTGLFAQETTDVEEKIKLLKKQISLGAVVKSDFRDAKDQKWERVKVSTEQDQDSPFMGTMRFTVELTDRAEQTTCGQVLKLQGKHPSGYDGKDEWTFEIPHGTMEKPKITAYSLEYGWETNKVFTPVRQVFYKAESADEIMERNKNPKSKLKITSKAKAIRQTDSGE
jgi:hypothetical protein